MGPTPMRIVLDTNVLVRAVVNVRSASGRILSACERRGVIALLSRPVLREYQATLFHPELVRRHLRLDRAVLKAALARLSYVGELHRSVSVRFEFRRDPRDAKFIELAIAGRATHLITSDPDLLDLKHGHDETAKRFRRRVGGLEVLEPGEFMASHGDEI